MTIKNMSKKTVLCHFFEESSEYIEIGIDEAGRGPMFGPVYAAAVVLVRDESFAHSTMKDSKRFHSKKKITQVAEYIKSNASAWGIGVCSAEEIDTNNIRNATHIAMHKAVRQVIEKLGKDKNYHLLVDGNDFRQMTILSKNVLMPIRHTCIEGGDNRYSAIAAASILAKVERDEYIEELCSRDNTLEEHYGIQKNKGYGTARHIDGIKKYGITENHRKSFGICKQFTQQN